MGRFKLPPYPATGIPYESMSGIRKFWKEKFPDNIDFNDLGAVNEHELIPGVSGNGKSSLEIQKIMQDYKAGKCVVLIDTLYSSFRDTLHTCIASEVPPEDVFPLDLTRPDLARCLMYFLEYEAGMDGVRREGIVGVIRDMPQWKKSVGERMIDLVYHELKALQLTDTPLIMANKFLMDFNYRDALLADIADDYAREELIDYFTHIYAMRDARMVIESTRNKLSVLINHDYIRPLISSNRSNFSFRDLMNRNCIVLINLSKRFFKDDSRALLACLLFYRILDDLLERENEKDPYPVSLYCEEFHEYAIPEFYIPILTGARKFGAGLKIITQSLGAFYREERDIMLGTVGSVSCFGVSDADAAILQENLFTYTGRTPKTVKWDILGTYDIPERYSVGDEKLNARNELKEQIQREFILRVRGKERNRLWYCTTSNLPKVEVSQVVEDSYRRASAKAWGID